MYSNNGITRVVCKKKEKFSTRKVVWATHLISRVIIRSQFFLHTNQKVNRGEQTSTSVCQEDKHSPLGLVVLRKMGGLHYILL
jgi:hypothetical protein